MRSKKRSRLQVEELESRLVLSTYYVATTGNDTTGTGNSATPFATIQHAADLVQAGDTVIVEAGKYAGFVMGWDTPTAGTSAAPITFEADPNAAAGSVIINAPNNKTHAGIDLEPGCDWITVEGFNIQGANIASYPNHGEGIKVTGNHDSVLNNTVSGIAYGFGIIADNANDVIIRGNTVSNTGYGPYGNTDYGHGIYLSGATDGAIITDNVLHDNAYIGLHVNGDLSEGGNGLVTNALIAGNLIYNNGQNGINADGIQSSTIENNVIYGFDGFGIALYQIDAGGPSSDNVIVNNTIVSTKSGAGAAVRLLDGATGNTLLNNVLLGGSGIAYRISADSLSGLTSDHNVTGGTYQSEDTGATQSLASWRTQTGQDAHSFTASASALFVNAAGNDYHLSATSPAIDAGTATDAPATDFAGNARPQGNGYDIGAYEFVTGTTPPPAPSAASFSVSAPSAATAGTSFQVTVSALDSSNNVVSGYLGTVHFTSSDGQAVLPADYAFTAADAGRHSFTITLETAGSETVTVTDTAHGSATGSASVLVTPAAASTFVVSGFPSTTTAGVAQSFTVTARDAYGNTATGYTGTVHFSSSDAQAALAADSTLSNGTGNFSATLKTAGTQTLKATDTANSSLSASVSAAVSPAAASALVVSGFPTTTTAGTAHSFTVTAEDPYGNTATGYTGTVQFSSSDPLALLPANATLTKGTGTFSATLNTSGTQSLSAATVQGVGTTGSPSGTEGGIVVQLPAVTTTHTWQQSTPIDFQAGTFSHTAVADASSGGLQLAPAFGDEFSGKHLSSAWRTTSWTSSGSIKVANGDLSLAGKAILSATTVGVAPVEARLAFGTSPWQHFGLATGLSSTSGNSWALFSTLGTDTLYARVNVNGVTTDVSLGTTPTGFHVYRIQPVAGGFQFYIDGSLQTTIQASMPATTKLRVALSDYTTATPLKVDWVHVLAYSTTGTFTSAVYDAGQVASWGTASWVAKLPAGTTITVQTRSGNTATPDSTWSAWAPVSNGGTIASPSGRYLQYRIVLTTTDTALSPLLSSIDFTWS